MELDSEGGLASSHLFDHVFGGGTGTDDVYREVGEDMIQRGLEGFNGTLFA